MPDVPDTRPGPPSAVLDDEEPAAVAVSLDMFIIGVDEAKQVLKEVEAVTDAHQSGELDLEHFDPSLRGIVDLDARGRAMTVAQAYRFLSGLALKRQIEKGEVTVPIEQRREEVLADLDHEHKSVGEA